MISPMATRRSHKKSRNGCEQCKQRRVKCDEKHPCSNCSRRGMTCSHEHRNSPTPRHSPADAETIFEDRDRILPSNSPRPLTQDPFGLFNQRLLEGSFVPREWTAQDAELMHHYTLYTSKTFAHRLEMQETWQVTIPKIAYSYEFLMHGILALSALHLAHLKPERYSAYLASSGFHMSLGLRTFRTILATPTHENCCALFSFCSIIMVYIYASPSEPSETSHSNGLTSILELLKLCRGTLVLHPYMHLLSSSDLSPLFLQEFTTHFSEPPNPTHVPLHPQFPNLPTHLSNLHHLITSDAIHPSQKEPFTKALNTLTNCFAAISKAPKPLECGMLFMWPLSIEEPFFTALTQQHPVALVFLGFYCVQMQAFSDFWFVGGEGDVWFERVEGVLDERYKEWLAWPMGVLRGVGGG